MPPPVDFAAAIRNHSGISLIAEVKKASPSAGIIRRDFDPLEIARIYAQEGAQCISVLTDRPFFAGDIEYLRQIRQAVSLPLLRKDFIIDEYQIHEARAAGADAVLLIAECLEPRQMQDLHDRITSLGMTALVEFYEARNLDSILDCKPVLVGVNNRDLNSFEVDLGHSIRMRERIPREILFVSESGIRTHDDVRLLAQHGVDAMLVGESLTRSKDIAAAMRSLLGFESA
jgi:indole-3-glycerol phosphate synthase